MAENRGKRFTQVCLLPGTQVQRGGHNNLFTLTLRPMRPTIGILVLNRGVPIKRLILY